MSRYIYNETDSLRSDFQPFARPSKTLRSDLPGFPGGVPNLTDRHLNAPPGVTATAGDSTNGRVQATILTRTRDQKQINKYQFAWVDTAKEGKVRLLSLQQMNQMLATDPNVRDLSMDKIFDRFHLYGVVSNNDADMQDDVPTDRIARTTTMTMWGASFVYDYWSSQERMLNKYDACYFIFKKMKIPLGTAYQTDISVAVHGRGVPTPGDLADNYVWQILPHASKEEFLNTDLYCTVDEDTGDTYPGFYWKVGHAHEYAQISTKEKVSVRKTPFEVARDISTLHLNANIPIIQFYTKILMPKLLINSSAGRDDDVLRMYGGGGGPRNVLPQGGVDWIQLLHKGPQLQAQLNHQHPNAVPLQPRVARNPAQQNANQANAVQNRRFA